MGCSCLVDEADVDQIGKLSVQRSALSAGLFAGRWPVCFFPAEGHPGGDTAVLPLVWFLIPSEMLKALCSTPISHAFLRGSSTNSRRRLCVGSFARQVFVCNGLHYFHLASNSLSLSYFSRLIPLLSLHTHSPFPYIAT